MKNNSRWSGSAILMGVLLSIAHAPAYAAPQQAPRGEADLVKQEEITREVRHELVTLPRYTLFDNLAYSVNDAAVTLVGQVVDPTLKKDAENAVRQVRGVETVENQIEVLPPSNTDDQFRMAIYRAVYGASSLQRYAVGAWTPIHIIVKNGHVTLEGEVVNEADKTMASAQASSVSGTFSVTNNLRVRTSR